MIWPYFCSLLFAKPAPVFFYSSKEHCIISANHALLVIHDKVVSQFTLVDFHKHTRNVHLLFLLRLQQWTYMGNITSSILILLFWSIKLIP